MTGDSGEPALPSHSNRDQNPSQSRIGQFRDVLLCGIVVILMVSGFATALAFVAVPLVRLPYPSNLTGAVVGLAALAVVLGVLKFLGGNILENLLILGIFGVMACLIFPSVRAERLRRQKSADTPAATAHDPAVLAINLRLHRAIQIGIQ